VLFAALFSSLRLILDLIELRGREASALQAEVLVLRQQVKVLERQVKRVRWQPSDRLLLALLRERLPRSAWAALLVQPGDRAGLASGAGSSPLGGLPRPASSWAPATHPGVQGADSEDGPGEPELGLPPDPRRALEAGPDRLCNCDPIGAVKIADPASWKTLGVDLEAFPGRLCQYPWWRPTSSQSTPSSCSGSTSSSSSTWPVDAFSGQPAPSSRAGSG